MAESGIYEIVNLVNGKRYVGSAIDLHKRNKEHFRDLRGKRHKNRHLQNAWLKYGADKFEFRILERVPEKDRLVEREQFHLDQGYDYNISPTAGSVLGVRHTPEMCAKKSTVSRSLWADPVHRAKLRAAHANREIPAGFGDAVRAGIAARIAKGLPFARQINPCRGRPLSEETKEKLRQANLGKRASPEARRKMSLSRLGKKRGPHSEETKAKMRAAWERRKAASAE